MAQHRTPLPQELKDLISLIRQGRLFEVQEWIRRGKPASLPEEGRFAISPAMAAVRTGFHSMVKVLLDAERETSKGFSRIWKYKVEYPANRRCRSICA